MDAHSLVDWLAFTVPVRHELDLNSYDIQGGGHRALTEFMGSLWNDLVVGSGSDLWERRNGRSPYSDSYYNGHGMTVFVGLRSQNVLVEFTGKGCDWLRDRGLLQPVIDCVHERVSRVDIATDLLCDTSPVDFVNAGYSKLFKTSGHVKSGSGETCYIGSKKSERYCRVYRYFEPHERAHLLRIEYVFRKGAAKKVVGQLRSVGIHEVAMGAANIYKWEHDHMKGKFLELDMKAYRPDRKAGKTLLWLIGQVAPAFRKLVKEGVIDDPEEFLKEHFIDSEEKDQ